jgi:hypothetical protein
MSNRTRSEVNLLDLIPERTVHFEVDNSRIVTVLAPRFKNRFLKRLLVRAGREESIRVTLDDIGSEVWLLCDGARNVGEIGDLLRGKFRERVEPCYERLRIFFQQLESARFIAFSNLEQCLKARDS